MLIETNDRAEFQETPGKVSSYVDDFLTTHDKYDIKKIDLLKINAIEILMNLIQFAPSVSIRAFILSEN